MRSPDLTRAAHMVEAEINDFLAGYYNPDGAGDQFVAGVKRGLALSLRAIHETDLDIHQEADMIAEGRPGK
jgi:hypothetical protein